MIEARQDAIQGIGFRIVSNRPEVSSMMDSPARAISDQHASQIRRMREFLAEWRGSVRKRTHGCLEAVSPFGESTNALARELNVAASGMNMTV